MSTSEPSSVLPEVSRAGQALRESERRDLEERLRVARSAARRHGLWAVLGVSPGALVPMLAAAHELGAAAAVGVSFFVVAVEAWRAIQARMDATELAARLDGGGRYGRYGVITTGSSRRGRLLCPVPYWIAHLGPPRYWPPLARVASSVRVVARAVSCAVRHRLADAW